MYFLSKILLFGIGTLTLSFIYSQSHLQAISLDRDDHFEGFEFLDTRGERLFILAEHWHNIRSVPQATFKLLQYLNQHANVRVLAIEQGKSAAWMINNYLQTGNEIMLEHITRNTMFWGKEHRQFFRDLRNYNQRLPEEDQILVKSIDIEYKMESAVFVINQFIGDKSIPSPLLPTLGEFKRIYEESRAHRESFDGIAIMFYYEQDFMDNLLETTISDLENNSDEYIRFFGDQFTEFATMILEMDDGLTFDYTNPNQNYKFRDRLIYKNFQLLLEEYPEDGILCAIGMRHVSKGSSIYNLDQEESSPVEGEVMVIRISALYNKSINSSDLKKINFNYPNQLKTNEATLIRHDSEDAIFKTKKKFDFTLFINENGSITPFENILKERY